MVEVGGMGGRGPVVKVEAVLFFLWRVVEPLERIPALVYNLALPFLPLPVHRAIPVLKGVAKVGGWREKGKFALLVDRVLVCLVLGVAARCCG